VNVSDYLGLGKTSPTGNSQIYPGDQSLVKPTGLLVVGKLTYYRALWAVRPGLEAYTIQSPLYRFFASLFRSFHICIISFKFY